MCLLILFSHTIHTSLCRETARLEPFHPHQSSRKCQCPSLSDSDPFPLSPDKKENVRLGYLKMGKEKNKNAFCVPTHLKGSAMQDLSKMIKSRNARPGSFRRKAREKNKSSTTFPCEPWPEWIIAKLPVRTLLSQTRAHRTWEK